MSVAASELIFCQTPVVKQRFSEKYKYPENNICILGFPPPMDMVTRYSGTIPSVFDKSSGNFYFFILAPYAPHRNPSILLPLCKRYATQFRERKIKFITTVELTQHSHVRKFLNSIYTHHLQDIIINVGSLSREDVAAYFAGVIAATEAYHARIIEEIKGGKPFRELAEQLGSEIHAKTGLLPVDFFQKNCGLLVKHSMKHEGIEKS